MGREKEGVVVRMMNLLLRVKRWERQDTQEG